MRILFLAAATVLDWESGDPVTDTSVIRSLDGTIYDEETFAEYLVDDPDPALSSLPVTGGILAFFLDPANDSLWAETAYQASRELSAAELEVLTEYTRGQWSDGIGENFSQLHAVKTGIFLEPDWQGSIIVRTEA